MNLFAIQGTIMSLISLAMFALQAYAFVDAVAQRADAFPAADKMTKQAWLIILGLGVVAHMLFWNPLSLFNIAGIIAAIVYLVDVRPAIKSLMRY